MSELAMQFFLCVCGVQRRLHIYADYGVQGYIDRLYQRHKVLYPYEEMRSVWTRCVLSSHCLCLCLCDTLCIVCINIRAKLT